MRICLRGRLTSWGIRRAWGFNHPASAGKESRAVRPSCSIMVITFFNFNSGFVFTLKHSKKF